MKGMKPWDPLAGVQPGEGRSQERVYECLNTITSESNLDHNLSQNKTKSG